MIYDPFDVMKDVDSKGLGYPKSQFLEGIEKIRKEHGVAYISERDVDVLISEFSGITLAPLGLQGIRKNASCFRCKWENCFDKCIYSRFYFFKSDERVINIAASMLKKKYTPKDYNALYKWLKVPWNIKSYSIDSDILTISVTGTKIKQLLKNEEFKSIFDEYIIQPFDNKQSLKVVIKK